MNNVAKRSWFLTRERQRVRFVTVLTTLFISACRLGATTSVWQGPGSDFNTPSNWSAGVPTDVAAFDGSGPRSLSSSAQTILNTLVFNSGAPSFVISTSHNSSEGFSLDGAGITNLSSHTQTVQVYTGFSFGNSATAGNASIIDFSGGGCNFFQSASAGFSTITNNAGTANFTNTSTAGNAAITNNSGTATNFFENSTAGNATITSESGASLNFTDNSTAGNAIVSNDGGATNFVVSSSAGNAVITNINGGGVNFNASTSAGGSRIVINSNSYGNFIGSSAAGNATIVVNEGGSLNFTGTTSGGHSTITNSSNVGIDFAQNSSAGDSTIINSGDGMITFEDNSTGGNAAIVVNDQAIFDITGLSSTGMSVGSLAGSGSFLLDFETLTVGSNNQSTAISGVISGDGGSLIKVGNGSLTLSGTNTYGGGTEIQAGSIILSGALASGVTVDPAGALYGAGRAGSLINNGIVTPGNSGAGKLSVASYSGSGTLNIALQGIQSTLLKVSGNANLTGTKLNVAVTNFTIGRYDMVTAGSVVGPFESVSIPLVPPLLAALLNYSPTAVSLLVRPAQPFESIAGTPNQRNIANALDQAEAGANTALLSTVNAVSQLSVADARSAFERMSGDGWAYYSFAALQNADLFFDDIQVGNPSPERRRPAFTGPIGNNNTVWARGLGSIDHVTGDSDIGSSVFNSETAGVQVGFETEVADHLKVGLTGGYAHTSLASDDRGSSGEGDSVESGVYSDYVESKWFVDLKMGLVSAANSGDRYISFGGTTGHASATFNSHLYGTTLTSGYKVVQGSTFDVAPYISFRQRSLAQDGFSESGAPGLNLDVQPVYLNSLNSAVGLSVDKTVDVVKNRPMTVALGAAWRHEFDSTANRIDAQLADTATPYTFAEQGTSRARESADVDFSLTCPLTSRLQLQTAYAVIVGSSEFSNLLHGGITLRW